MDLVTRGGRKAPLRRTVRWFFSTAQIICACVTLGGRAHAADGVTVANDEIYVDLTTGYLGRRLQVGADKVNKLVLAVPEKSVVTLHYWPSADTDCTLRPPPLPGAATLHGQAPAATNLGDPSEGSSRDADWPPLGLITRAGAPTGAVVDVKGVRMQKSLVEVAGLKVGKDYCFALNVQERRPLPESRRMWIDAGLLKTIGVLAGDSAPTCKLPSTGDATATTQEVADLFVCHLGRDADDVEVVLPGRGESVQLKTAFATLLAEDGALTAEIQQAWQARQNAQAATENLEEVLESTSFGAVVGTPGSRTTIAADPMQGIESRDFAASLVDPELKAIFSTAILVDRDALLSRVWDHREKLKNVGVADGASRRPLTPDAKEKRLMAILQSPSAPVRVVLDQEKVESLRKELLGMLKDPKLRAERVVGLLSMTKSLKVMPPSHPGLADLPKDQQDRLQAFVRLVGEVDGQSRVIDTNLALASALLKSPSYLRLRDSLMQLTVTDAVKHHTLEPSYMERFPFYVSVDMGILFGFLSDGDELARTDIASYFGVNFYLAPVDKDEKLGLPLLNGNGDTYGRGFLRRFSLTAGISLTDFQRSSDLGVSGVIGEQLLLGGGGFRLTDYLRASGGALFYTQDSTSTLSDETSLRVAPYAAVSLDLDAFTELKKAYDSATN